MAKCDIEELSESGKRRKKCQQPVQDQSMTMENSWMIMMHQTRPTGTDPLVALIFEYAPICNEKVY